MNEGAEKGMSFYLYIIDCVYNTEKKKKMMYIHIYIYIYSIYTETLRQVE